MPTLFSTTGLDVTETGKAPARMSGGFLAECDCIRLLQAIKLGNRNHILISDCANHIASEGHGDTVIAIAQGIRQGNFKVICSNLALSILVITLRTHGDAIDRGFLNITLAVALALNKDGHIHLLVVYVFGICRVIDLSIRQSQRLSRNRNLQSTARSLRDLVLALLGTLLTVVFGSAAHVGDADEGDLAVLHVQIDLHSALGLQILVSHGIQSGLQTGDAVDLAVIHGVVPVGVAAAIDDGGVGDADIVELDVIDGAAQSVAIDLVRVVQRQILYDDAPSESSSIEEAVLS